MIASEGSKDIALEVSSASKKYGGLEVLSEVNTRVSRGSFYGVVGPNGAGKTTLLNAISGIVPLDSGEVWVNGTNVTRLPVYQRVQEGMARTFQTVRLVPGRTVLDQVIFGAYQQLKRDTLRRLAMRSESRAKLRHIRKDAIQILDRLGLGSKVNQIAEILPYGDQRRVEIARALVAKPSLLLLDEPTAGMAVNEWVPLVELLKGLVDEGLTVVLIEHNMKLVESSCERVMVLDFGRVLAEGPPKECLRREEVRQAYFGREGIQYGGRFDSR